MEWSGERIVEWSVLFGLLVLATALVGWTATRLASRVHSLDIFALVLALVLVHTLVLVLVRELALVLAACSWRDSEVHR